MPSSSELVPWDQEKGQWHRPKGGGGQGGWRRGRRWKGEGGGGGGDGEEREEGATRDSACECSSTLPE